MAITKLLLSGLGITLVMLGFHFVPTVFPSGTGISKDMTTKESTTSAQIQSEPTKVEEDIPESPSKDPGVPIALPSVDFVLPQPVVDETKKLTDLGEILKKMSSPAIQVHFSNLEISKLYSTLLYNMQNDYPICQDQLSGISDPYTYENLMADCISTWTNGYQLKIATEQSTRDSALSNYRLFESQAKSIMSSCSSACKTVWDGWVNALIAQGVSLP